MFENLDIFRISAAMARHAGDRQALTAKNIANADTPGYRAERLASFSDSFRNSDQGVTPRQTRPGHIGGTAGSILSSRPTFTTTEASPNGNTVSLEEEMLQSADIQREHDKALAIYKHGLTVLRSVLGR
jgi:flagellar basal-body rod protein FlgB